MKRTKIIVALLLLCVMCVGGSVAVFADDVPLMTIYDSDNMAISVPYTDLDYLYISSGNFCYFLVNPVVYAFDGTFVSIRGELYYTSTSGGAWSLEAGGSKSVQTNVKYLKVATSDLYFENKVVFQKTVVPVVAVAKNLPNQVLPTIKTIVIAGVGGLALVVGFLILPKKLYLFLRG